MSNLPSVFNDSVSLNTMVLPLPASVSLISPVLALMFWGLWDIKTKNLANYFMTPNIMVYSTYYLPFQFCEIRENTAVDLILEAYFVLMTLLCCTFSSFLIQLFIFSQ